MHFQVCVQCVHQHTPLYEIMEMFNGNMGNLLEEYKNYKEHVCRQMYADPELWKHRQDDTEAAWPNYETYWDLIRVPEKIMPEKLRSSVYNGFKNVSSYLSEGKDYLRMFFCIKSNVARKCAKIMCTHGTMIVPPKYR